MSRAIDYKAVLHEWRGLEPYETLLRDLGKDKWTLRSCTVLTDLAPKMLLLSFSKGIK